VISSKLIALFSGIYLVAFFAIGSGIISALVEAKNIQPFLLIPDRGVQTIGESIIGVMIMFMGLGGIVLVHRSTKPTGKRKQTNYFIAGFAVLTISIMAEYMLLTFKIY